MPRKYRHIQEHEKEILELRSQGMTLREIGEKFGFTHKEMCCSRPFFEIHTLFTESPGKKLVLSVAIC